MTTDRRPSGQPIRRTASERSALATMDAELIAKGRKFWIDHAPAGRDKLIDARPFVEGKAEGQGESAKAGAIDVIAEVFASVGTAGRSAWEFLSESRVFRKVSTGAKLAVAKVRKSVEFVVSEGERRAKQLAAKLIKLKVSLPQWQQGMETLIRAVHAATGLVGGGGKNAISAAEKAAIEKKILHQLEFIEKFAVEVAEGLGLNGQIGQRAAQYLTAAIATFEASRRVGDYAAGWTYERRLLNSATPCPECTDYAAQGWQLTLILPDIGEDCSCKSRCKCSWERARELPSTAPTKASHAVNPTLSAASNAIRPSGTYWAITREAYAKARAASLSPLASLIPSPEPDARSAGSGYKLAAGVAVIPVRGAIYRYSSPLGDMLAYLFGGGVSVDAIADSVRVAVADPAAKSLLMVFDSPGGTVAGIGELAAEIRKAGSVKPVAAYADALCCSAAYWLASACGEITASPSALLGSIGVYATVGDDSDFQEMTGIREYLIGNDDSPDKLPDPSTEEGRAIIRRSVNALFEVFSGDIAKYRGVPLATVLSDFGKGDTVPAPQAVSVKMADKVGYFDDVLRKMSGANRSRLAANRPAAAASATPAPLKLRLRRA